MHHTEDHGCGVAARQVKNTWVTPSQDSVFAQQLLSRVLSRIHLVLCKQQHYPEIHGLDASPMLPVSQEPRAVE